MHKLGSIYVSLIAGFSALLFLTSSLALAAETPPKDENKCAKLRKCDSMVVSKLLTAGEITEGVVYSVPTQLMEFSIVRAELTSESLQESLDKAQEQVKANELEMVKKASEISVLESYVREATSNEANEAKAKFGLDLELAKIELIILKKLSVKFGEALQTAKTELSIFNSSSQDSQYKDAISLRALNPVPDANLKFSARLNNSALSSETFEIKTTTSGLLSGGSGKSEGQADEIFIALAKAIATLNSPVSPSTKNRESSSIMDFSLAENCKATVGESYSARFSLEKLEETLEEININLQHRKFCYELSLASPSISQLDCEVSVEPIGYYDGLLYPTRSNIEFELASKDGSKLKQSFFADTISSCYLGRLSLQEGYLSDNEFEYEFSDGILTRYKSVTPNQLLSLLSIIPEAGKALLSIPAELIQLKIDFSSKDKAYYEAQEAAIAARASYEGYLNSFPANTPADVVANEN